MSHFTATKAHLQQSRPTPQSPSAKNALTDPPAPVLSSRTDRDTASAGHLDSQAVDHVLQALGHEPSSPNSAIQWSLGPARPIGLPPRAPRRSNSSPCSMTKTVAFRSTSAATAMPDAAESSAPVGAGGYSEMDAVNGLSTRISPTHAHEYRRAPTGGHRNSRMNTTNTLGRQLTQTMTGALITRRSQVQIQPAPPM